MALVRCTCLYSTVSAPSGEVPLVVAAPDPWCPAEAVHRRFGQASPDRPDVVLPPVGPATC